MKQFVAGLILTLSACESHAGPPNPVPGCTQVPSPTSAAVLYDEAVLATAPTIPGWDAAWLSAEPFYRGDVTRAVAAGAALTQRDITALPPDSGERVAVSFVPGAAALLIEPPAPPSPAGFASVALGPDELVVQVPGPFDDHVSEVYVSLDAGCASFEVAIDGAAPPGSWLVATVTSAPGSVVVTDETLRVFQ